MTEPVGVGIIFTARCYACALLAMALCPSVYIVDLENFSTASRRYTGDIHNSSVVGLFMTPIGQYCKKT